MGDFNINFGKNSTDKTKLKSTLCSFGLDYQQTSYTRTTANTHSTIDLIFLNNLAIQKFTDVKVANCSFSDHDMLLISHAKHYKCKKKKSN